MLWLLAQILFALLAFVGVLAFGVLVGTVAAGADAGEATLTVTAEGLEPRTVALSVR